MDNNENKYIATAMKRYKVGNESYIFVCSHTILGNIDPETSIFTDQFGNLYGAYLDKSLMESDIDTAYANFIGINDIDAVVEGKQSFQEKLKEYEARTKDIIYYVGKVDEDTPFYIPLSISGLAEGTKASWNNQQENLEEYTSSPIIDSYSEGQAVDVDEADWEDYMTEMDPELSKLVTDIINGKLSVDEINDIRDDLAREKGDIESVLETIDLQLEATETGTASIAMRELSEDEKKESEENFNGYIDTEDLFNKVTRTLIAQDDAARRVIAEIARKEMHPKKKKEGILLTGKTGVGKTALMSLIAKYLDRPFIKIDSTQLTIPGYVGKDIEEYLWQLYVKCGCNKDKAEHAIVFFDEIDKKATGRKGDVSGEGVLDVLLSFIEGTTYDACFDTKTSNNKVSIDTSNMISVFGGAYTDVYKDLKEDKSMGFNGNINPKERKATPKDFIEKGRTKDEFIGRVAVVKLKDLDFDDIKRLILESDESAIKIQEQIFAELGVKITFTDGYVNAIAKGAVERETGARGLNTIIDETTWEAFDTVYKKSNHGKYSEVILDEETVKNPKHYQLIKRVNEVQKDATK